MLWAVLRRGDILSAGQLERICALRSRLDPRTLEVFLWLRVRWIAPPTNEPTHRVEELIGDSFFEGNDGVIRDVDVLRTDLLATLGYVAETHAALLFDRLAPIQ